MHAFIPASIAGFGKHSQQWKHVRRSQDACCSASHTYLYKNVTWIGGIQISQISTPPFSRPVTVRYSPHRFRYPISDKTVADWEVTQYRQSHFWVWCSGGHTLETFHNGRVAGRKGLQYTVVGLVSVSWPKLHTSLYYSIFFANTSWIPPPSIKERSSQWTSSRWPEKLTVRDDGSSFWAWELSIRIEHHSYQPCLVVLSRKSRRYGLLIELWR